MKKIIVLLGLSVLFTACGSNEPVTKTKIVNVNSANAIWTETVTPYKQGAMIAQNIKNECAINTELPEYIQQYGKQQGIDVNLAISVSKKPNRLSVEIVDAISSGSAFIGHRKYVKAAGTLYKNGKKVASFTAARFSGGGFWGAYKGSCSVLNRTVNTIGKDIALWLTSPVDGMHLGDAI